MTLQKSNLSCALWSALVLLAVPGGAFAQEADEEDDLVVEAEPEAPTAPAQGETAPAAPSPTAPAVEPSVNDPAQAPVAPLPQGPTVPVVPAAPGASVEAEVVPPEAAPSDGAANEAPQAAEPLGFMVPEARSPVGDTNLPRSLLAEGSNYVRPLRLGLAWWGFAQAEYYRNQISENQLDPDGESLNRDQFGVRRARLRIDHGWEYGFATLEIDAGTFDGPNIQIRRAEASLLYRGGTPDSVTPPLVLTAGVTDVPFGAEVGESQRDRLFMERSLGSVALFPSLADGGLKLWGALGFVNYAVALVNGESRGPVGIPIDQDSHKDIAGRVGVAMPVAETVFLAGGLSFYVGKGTSPGTLATKDTVAWIDLNNNGVTDSGEIQGITGSAATPSRTYDRWATGLDVATSIRHPFGVLQLAAEAFYASNLDRGVLPLDPIVAGASSRQLGVMGSVVQQVSRWAALGLRVAYYDPNSNLIEQRAGVFHLKNQAFSVFTPVVAFTLPHGRIAAQYDFVRDHLGRDGVGVPANVRNNAFTVRLQVDL